MGWNSLNSKGVKPLNGELFPFGGKLGGLSFKRASGISGQLVLFPA